MMESRHGFGLLLRRQICLNAIWPGGQPASLALSLRPIGLAALALAAHTPNWLQTNLATSWGTKPASLIES